MLDQILDSPLVNRELLTEFKRNILESLFSEKGAFYSIEEIISWLTILKTNIELEVERCDLDALETWHCSDDKISHKKNKYFEIIGVEAEIGHREVARWCQPLLKQMEEGIVGFIVKKIHSIYHLLVQAKIESGNFDIIEMAPTVQCITGSYKKPEYDVAYLDYFLHEKGIVYYDTLQSEEGGRFYQEQNRYMVIEVGQEFPIEVPEKFIWMTFRQAKVFIMFNNFFNIEARSLISCVSPV
jgi:oxidase EvaA